MSSVLWLHSPKFSAAQKNVVNRYVQRVGMNSADIFYVTMHYRIKDMWMRKTKTQWRHNEAKTNEFWKTLTEYVEKVNPKVIVVNDDATMGYILGYTVANKPLDLCRGSVYNVKIKDKYYPVMAFDDILKINTIKYQPWIVINDLSKLRRWVEGNQRNEPAFRYTVVRNRHDFHNFLSDYDLSSFKSCDIETANGFITALGFSFLHDNGSINSWVIPFYNPLKSNNCHWELEEDETFVWFKLRECFADDSIKIFQNGAYDCAYLLSYRCCPRNYFVDTMHLFHSIWTEAPKRLNFISSICMDHMRYWKDELKGEKDERIPTTVEGLEKYWRYNAYDCYTTLMSAICLLNMITEPNLKWALANYTDGEFLDQMGPAFCMSMTGMKCNKERQAFKTRNWIKEHHEALKKIRIMVDDIEFNPNSSPQFASLVYDVLGARPIKLKGKSAKKLQANDGKSVDEKILKIIKLQHPIYDIFIQAVWDTKKPKNQISKYGNLQLLNDRFMYNLAAITETGRYKGRQHQFWIGTNPQNIPKKTVRDMFTADDGYILFEADYSQSDNWFVAFESGDPDMIANITDDRDTHCVHAAYFFQKDYLEVYQGHLDELEWVEDPLTGVRQLTKKIVHGSNYRMSGYTLYVEMGHDALVATAKKMGHNDAHLWTMKQLCAFGDYLIASYYKMYTQLPLWFESSVEECANNGSLATCAFGRTRLFFGDIRSDQSIQRQLSAYYGQGGTAGNINRTLRTVYFGSDLIQRGLILLTQTHDSITGQVPYQQLDLIKDFLKIMAGSTTIRGRTFTVPVDCKVGISWGSGLMSWREDITFEEILANEEKYEDKKFPGVAPIPF